MKLDALGIINYSNMLTYVANQRSDINVLSAIEYPYGPAEKSSSIYSKRTAGIENICFDSPLVPNIKISEDGVLIKRTFYKPDLVYSQPVFSKKRGVIDDFDRVLNKTEIFNPEYYLFVTTMRFSKDIIEYLKDDEEYRWTVVRVNALSLNIPMHTAYLIIVGSKSKKSPLITNLHSEKISTVKDAISDLETINGDNGHYLLKNKGFQISLLYDSIKMLKEGEALYNVPKENHPEIVKRYKNVMKSQLPVRLSYNKPSPSMSIAPKYIHPTQDRPITPREMARLLQLPDDFKINNREVTTVRYFGNIIPPPVCNFAFDLIQNMNNGKTFDNPIYVNASMADDSLFREMNKE